MSADKLAIAGGRPARSEPFPAWPIFDEREERLLLEVLRSGQWGVFDETQGKAAEFARRFAAFQQARFGVTVANGTLGLELALRALGAGPGDEVVTSPYTFVATAGAVLTVGARPVFVDVEQDSYNIDPDLVEAAITRRTRAILPVHIAGRPADMGAILAIAARHGLPVIEDACQAWGAEWEGRRVGAIGDLGVFSFQLSKNITAGEGGIVITNSEELADRCWSLHNVGRRRGGARYDHALLGSNLRLTEWQGALLLAQLERLPQHMLVRTANARYLASRLSECAGVALPSLDVEVTSHAWHLFMFRYRAAAFGARALPDFVAALRAEGVPCSTGYVPLYRSPAIVDSMARLFGALPMPRCPVTEMLCAETVWLPQNVLLGTQADMDSIVEAIAKIRAAWA